ncbi:MAG: hypothetical protein ACRD16_03290 [Thermoanaerobaculia bacterium]
MKKRKQSQERKRPGHAAAKLEKLDEGMTGKEKDSLAEQVEEFEGPDRREKRGSEVPEPHEPGVARS